MNHWFQHVMRRRHLSAAERSLAKRPGVAGFECDKCRARLAYGRLVQDVRFEDGSTGILFFCGQMCRDQSLGPRNIYDLGRYKAFLRKYGKA